MRTYGRVIAVAPVTWTKGRYTKKNSADIFQQVWFQNPDEMETHRTSPEPFVVAVAMAKNYSHFPHEFEEFRAVLEVVATGEAWDNKSIETKVIRRLTSNDFADALIRR